MLRATAERLKLFFKKRKIAYTRVFDAQSPFTRVVLSDLEKYCCAYQSTFHKDERVCLILQGRRDVFLRIAENLNLDLEDIYNLHVIKGVAKDEE
jgi:hypothetical protein